MQTETTKKKIISFAMELFVANGIISVKMNDIANGLHISKRTVYKLFPHKEDLVFAGIKAFHEDNDNERDEFVREHNGDILSILYWLLNKQIDVLPKIRPVFYDDIQKYPKVQEYIEEHRRDEKAQIKAFLAEGVKQGIFRDDINYNLFMDILSVCGQAFSKEKLYFKYPLIDILNNGTLVLLRGIMTESARKKLNF